MVAGFCRILLFLIAAGTLVGLGSDAVQKEMSRVFKSTIYISLSLVYFAGSINCKNSRRGASDSIMAEVANNEMLQIAGDSTLRMEIYCFGFGDSVIRTTGHVGVYDLKKPEYLIYSTDVYTTIADFLETIDRDVVGLTYIGEDFDTQIVAFISNRKKEIIYSFGKTNWLIFNDKYIYTVNPQLISDIENATGILMKCEN